MIPFNRIVERAVTVIAPGLVNKLLADGYAVNDDNERMAAQELSLIECVKLLAPVNTLTVIGNASDIIAGWFGTTLSHTPPLPMCCEDFPPFFDRYAIDELYGLVAYSKQYPLSTWLTVLRTAVNNLIRMNEKAAQVQDVRTVSTKDGGFYTFTCNVFERLYVTVSSSIKYGTRKMEIVDWKVSFYSVSGSYDLSVIAAGMIELGLIPTRW